MATDIFRIDNPGEDVIEFRVRFTRQDWERAQHLTTILHDHLNEPLSEETPLADLLLDLQTMMLRIEQDKKHKIT